MASSAQPRWQGIGGGILPAASHTQNIVVQSRFNEGTATITVSGELDIFTVPVLAAVLKGVLGKGADGLILDLAHVTFLDCGSARELAAGSRALPGARKAVIRRPSASVARVLQLTGMDSDFVIARPSGEGGRSRPYRSTHGHDARSRSWRAPAALNRNAT